MFHTSDETQEALSDNKPGAHAMHELHNLIHQAEHTAATKGGDHGLRDKYVLSLLQEIEALALRASREIRGLQPVPPAPVDPMARRMAAAKQKAREILGNEEPPAPKRKRDSKEAIETAKKYPPKIKKFTRASKLGSKGSRPRA